MDKLKNCPFRGGEAEKPKGEKGDGSPWYYIECLECGSVAEPDIWNTRPIEQALLKALKRSQQQRDEIFADLAKAQEALKECLTLIDNNGLSPRGNLRKKVAEAIQGDEGCLETP